MPIWLVIGLLCAALFLVIGVRIFDAIISAIYYWARQRLEKETPEKLKRYYDTKQNIHFAATGFWYCLFFGVGTLVFIIFCLINPDFVLWDLLCAYSVTQGASAIAGPYRQGYINLGCNLKWDGNESDNPAERDKEMVELANPFTGKSKWYKRFWYGNNRKYAAYAGVLMIVLGILIVVTKFHFTKYF